MIRTLLGDAVAASPRHDRDDGELTLTFIFSLQVQVSVIAGVQLTPIKERSVFNLNVDRDGKKRYYHSRYYFQTILNLIERLLRRKARNPVSLLRSELLRLANNVGFFRKLLNLTEVEAFMLEISKIVDASRILRCDVIDLRKIPLLNDREVDVREQSSSVDVQVLPCLFGHHSSVQLSRLIVLRHLAFVKVVRLSGDDVVGDLVRSFSGIGTELVGKGVGGVLLVPSVVRVYPHLAIEVEA